MSATVSIVTPAFNCGSHAAAAIESVLSQSFQEWELILIDDASADDTPDILESYALADSRIQFLRQETNRGSAAARNLGLSRATAPLIAFLDADDLWAATKLERQLDFMLTRNLPITFTAYEVVDENGRRVGRELRAPSTVDLSQYLKTTVIGCSTSIVNRSLVGDFSFVDIRTRQDTQLWISLLSMGFHAYGLDEVLAQYRLRPGSISSNKIRAATQVWWLYHRYNKLGAFRSLYYFTHYAVNSIRRRL